MKITNYLLAINFLHFAVWQYALVLVIAAFLVSLFIRSRAFLHLRQRALPLRPAAKIKKNFPIRPKKKRKSALADLQTNVSAPVHRDLEAAQMDLQDRVKNIAQINKLWRQVEKLLAAGEIDEAHKTVVSVLSLDEKHKKALSQLAYIYLHKDELGKAEAAYKRAIEQSPKNAVLYSNLGMVFFKQRRYEDAKETYQRAIKIEGRRAARHISLGQVLYMLRDFEGCRQSFERASQLEPRNIDYLFTLANYYLELGEKGEAKRALERILHISPYNEEAKEKLAEIQ